MIDDDSKLILGTFGPRPSDATQMVNEFKMQNGSLTEKFKEDLQLWYNKNRGQNIVNNLVEFLQV